MQRFIYNPGWSRRKKINHRSITVAVSEWYGLFKNSTYADACLDRLLHRAYRLNFQGESLRTK